MKLSGSNTSIIFFGNEKLATGISEVEPVIYTAVKEAGFTIEKKVTGKLHELGDHTSQLAVLAAYGRIIPQSVLDEFPLGIINIHPSLLPLYRGPTPIEQAILDGASKTGVSIMKLTAGMDEGPLYKQKTVHLSGNETKQSLTQQLQKLGADLLVDVLPSIASGDLSPRQQPHPDRATYSKKLTKQDGLLDWNKPADVLEREVRAFQGWPKSYTKLAQKDVVILATNISRFTGQPGAVVINNNEIHICCKQNSLQIIELKPAGKKAMTAEAFLAGYRALL